MNGIHWKILMFCNEKVRSITEILEHFKATSETDIKDTITALYSQGLLYYSIFREECVSIINMSYNKYLNKINGDLNIYAQNSA